MPIPQSKVPSLREAERSLQAQTLSAYTIGCCHCRKPLWRVSNIKRYGTKISADKEAYPGVPEYNDIWSANGKECSEVLCWFCGEMWLKAIKAGEHVFAKPYVIELNE